jgi:hypothetical protein
MPFFRRKSDLERCACGAPAHADYVSCLRCLDATARRNGYTEWAEIERLNAPVRSRVSVRLRRLAGRGGA